MPSGFDFDVILASSTTVHRWFQRIARMLEHPTRPQVNKTYIRSNCVGIQASSSSSDLSHPCLGYQTTVADCGGYCVRGIVVVVFKRNDFDRQRCDPIVTDGEECSLLAVIMVNVI